MFILSLKLLHLGVPWSGGLICHASLTALRVEGSKNSKTNNKINVTLISGLGYILIGSEDFVYVRIKTLFLSFKSYKVGC